VNGRRRMEWLNVRSWMVDVNKDCLAVNKIVAVEH
jgi:hypothetical protein